MDKTPGSVPLVAPRVSVIMAVYNGARYLQEAIESILSQTFSDFEFVIINDGSTDGSVDIVKSYADPRIVLLENESNIGLTCSLNRGIQCSRGELIARQDADDVSLPERLARQVAYLDEHPEVGLVGSGVLWIDEKGGILQEWRPVTDPVQIQRLLLTGIPFRHGTFVFRRQCLLDIGGGYDEKMPVAQDCDLLLRIAESWELANLNVILYRFRVHSTAITAQRANDQDVFLKQAVQAATQRRLAYGWGRVSLRISNLPPWMRHARRDWLARRYVWWSASARAVNKWIAVQFLLIAILLCPSAPDNWRYLTGILKRKTPIGERP